MRFPSLHRLTATIALSLLAILAGAAPAGAETRASAASPGSAGLGDRLFPALGNGGYDAMHYHLDLRYATAAPAQSIDGTVTIVARATQALSRFNLDFGGQSVGSVSVNFARADWVREGEELVITPSRPIRDHALFVVQVSHFTAAPTELIPGDYASAAFFITPDGSATAPQPDFAHRIFPANDHPRDKASYSFRFDVPAGTVAVANGVPTGSQTRGERTIWTYVQRQPMASELIQLAVGDYDLTWRGNHGGVLVRDVTAPSLTDFLEPKLALELGHLDWMDARVGDYPFDIYGTFVVDAEFGFALETQTLSIFDRIWFTEFPQGVWEPTMVHELVHMWFGDSVSPYEWSDLWINEGHASWYEFLYAEEKGLLEEDTTGYPNEIGYADFDDLMQAVYALGDQWRAEFGPVAEPVSADSLFSLNVYHGGALVLYALRQEIGDEAFDRLERTWVQRYRGRSASTADFIALASEVAGRDLSEFLGEWLYGDVTPPMPGHPDWTVLPVEPAVTAALQATVPAQAAGRR